MPSVWWSRPTKWDVGTPFLSSFPGRMSGGVLVRLCVLFDAEHARLNRKLKNKKPTTTSKTLEVCSWGYHRKAFEPKTFQFRKEKENKRRIILKENLTVTGKLKVCLHLKQNDMCLRVSMLNFLKIWNTRTSLSQAVQTLESLLSPIRKHASRM